MQFAVADAAAMDALGSRLASALDTSTVVYLHGELGAGKTTLVRGVLRGLGFQGPVRSPTYTLVEGYEFTGRVLQHLDLYRIRAAEELEYLGLRELDAADSWVFVEWPERGIGGLPAPDLEVHIDWSEPGRHLGVWAHSERGRRLAEDWYRQVEAAPVPGLTVSKPVPNV